MTKKDVPPVRGIEKASHLNQHDQDLISRILDRYHDEEIQLVERVHFHKIEKSVNKKQHRDFHLLIGKFRFLVLKSKTITHKKRLYRNYHVYDIRKITVSGFVMKMETEDDGDFYLTPWKDGSDTSPSDQSSTVIFASIIEKVRMGQSWITSSDIYNQNGHIQLDLPQESNGSLITNIGPIVRGPSGGLHKAYISASNYSKEPLIFQDFIEHIDHAERTGEDWLDLRFLPGPVSRSDAYLGIHTVLFSLMHNNYFKTLIIKNISLQTGSLFGLHKIQYGNLLGKAQISRFFRYNTTISKVIVYHPSSGGADLDWEGMANAIKNNPNNQLQHLDVSENKLNIRQVYSISKAISCLGHGLKVLKLVNCNLNDRGLNFILRALEHQEVCFSLEELDLSQNLFAESSSAHLATYLKTIADHSKLRVLGLRNTQVLFKMVLPWIRVVTSLEYLDLSMNRLDRVDPPDVGFLLHLPNLTHLDLSMCYVFEDAIFGLFTAKPPNKTRKLNINLNGNMVSGFEVVAKSLAQLVYGLNSLDLTGMRLRGKGIAKILPILTERAPDLTRLDIGKNLVASSEAIVACEAIVAYLQANPQLRRLGIVSDHLNPSYKDGIHIVFKSLETNFTLEDLDVSENYLGDRIFLDLIQSLKKNKSLKIIRIDKNNLSPNTFLSLKNCLERHNNVLEDIPWPRCDYRNSYHPLNKERRLQFVHLMQQIYFLLQKNRGGALSKILDHDLEDLRRPLMGLIPLCNDLPEALKPQTFDHSVAASFPMDRHLESELEAPPNDPTAKQYSSSRHRSNSIESNDTTDSDSEGENQQ